MKTTTLIFSSFAFLQIQAVHLVGSNIGKLSQDSFLQVDEKFWEDYLDKDDADTAPTAPKVAEAKTIILAANSTSNSKKNETLASGKSTVSGAGGEFITVGIDLQNLNNEQYIGNIVVGDEKQQLPVLFDTGSSLMYVVTDSCQNELCPQQIKYKPGSSAKYKLAQDKDPLAKCYGKGCVSGQVSQDQVCFSADDNKACLSGATFLAVNEATDIEKDKFSGIVGLSPQSDLGRIPAFVEQIGDLGGVGGQNFIKPTFSIFLSNQDGQPGKITFGGYDLAAHAKQGAKDSDVFWANMAHKKDFFWTVNMDNNLAFSDGKKLEVESRHMILDSGVSYALIPSEDFTKVSSFLDKNYGVKCKAGAKNDNSNAQVDPSDCACPDMAKLPDISLSVLKNSDDKKGQALKMPRDTYIKSTGDGKCKLLLNPSDMQVGANFGENQWLMGDQFMQAVYTIYDAKERKVGFIESSNSFAAGTTGQEIKE